MAHKAYNVKTTSLEVFTNVADVVRKLDGIANVYPATIDYTFKDMRNRAPGKIVNAVRDIYNIKKNEISYKVYSESRKDFHHTFNWRRGGHIYVGGGTLQSMGFYFAGNPLTPIHFNMTPKQKPPKGKKYKIKAEILKGRKINFRNESKHPEGGVFLAKPPRGNQIIPWFRNSNDSNDIEPIKTVSLPQMVDNEKARKIMNQGLGELLHSRFNHHLKRNLKKAIK